jgi:hypothetical protein
VRTRRGRVWREGGQRSGWQGLMEVDGKRLRWCEIDNTHKLLLRMRRQNIVGSCWRSDVSFWLSLIS